MARHDVVIVGGGAIGSAVAYFLAADPGFDGSVAVVERDSTYATASTARSVSAIRQQFTTPENVRISQFGIAFLRNAAACLAVDGEQAEIGLVEAAYLFLADARSMPVLEAAHAMQRGLGVAVALLAPAALSARFPFLSMDGLAGGSLGLDGEGWFDSYALLQAFRRKARSLGVAYVEAEATGLDVEGGRVAAVRLGDGSRLSCGAVVNAAGPRARGVAAMAGVDIPVFPRKRQVHVFDCRSRIDGLPLTICPNGVYVRPESGRYICGVAPDPADDPDTLDLEADESLFEAVVWPTLAERIPAFEAIRRTGGWAGHYAMNIFDHNALVGALPERPNLYLANGFSGHGMQQSPAVGRAVAELIVHGRFVTLDLEAFSPARIAAGRPVLELAVV